MSNRRTKIIETSIKLFNQKGCLNTSTRHIADELGISVGNLYYYFKNKEEILISIYNEFIASISSGLNNIKEGIDSSFDFYNFLNTQIEMEKKCMFYRLEMNNIYFTYKRLRELIETTLVNKIEEIKKVYQHQIKYGYIKKLDNFELDFLCSNTWIVASQWELYWVIRKCENIEKRHYYGALNFLCFIKGYMTKKGLEESNLLDSIEYFKKEISNVK